MIDTSTAPWYAALPPLRGRVIADAPLAAGTWFRVGGSAEVLVRPADIDDLVTCMTAASPEWPVTILGAASNIIIRDGGVPGLVVKLGRGFGEIAIEPDGVIAGAAALDTTIADHAAMAGLGGLEFLSGIPGSLGGAVAMNAGAFGADMRSVLDWAEIIGPDGSMKRYGADELGLDYRHARLPPGGIVVRARLRAHTEERNVVIARMDDIKAQREATQPVRARTGGSTFRNPPGHKAWQLIDQAGCRGMLIGDAQVSEKHCNFLINRGQATASDLEALGELVRERVQAMFGVELLWEIKRMGIPGGVT